MSMAFHLPFQMAPSQLDMVHTGNGGNCKSMPPLRDPMLSALEATIESFRPSRLGRLAGTER